MTWRYVSVLYLMQNCKILYCRLYLECWKIVMYWTSSNLSWSIKCQHWSLYHSPVLCSLYKSHMFASPVPGWVGCPLLQTATCWTSQGCGRIWSELSWGPPQPVPACAALAHRSRCAASPADSVSGTLKKPINETHKALTVQGLSSFHNINPPVWYFE